MSARAEERLFPDGVPSEAERLRKNVADMLSAIAPGPQATCKGCEAPIWFVRHRNGKLTPYSANAVNHFAECKYADRFSKK